MVFFECALTKKKGIMKKLQQALLKLWIFSGFITDWKNLIKVSYNDNFLIANFIGTWGNVKLWKKVIWKSYII